MKNTIRQALRAVLKISAYRVFLFLMLCGWLTGASQAEPISKIADIKAHYIALDGKDSSFSEMKGKPVLIVFWASWCIPCLAEVPTLNDLNDRFGQRGLQVVGVNLDASSTDDLKKIAGKFKIRYKVALAKEELAKELAIPAIPYSLLFASDGSLIKTYHGQPQSHILIGDVEKALAKGP